MRWLVPGAGDRKHSSIRALWAPQSAEPSAIANLSVSRQDSSLHQRHVALALGRGHLDECSRHGGRFARGVATETPTSVGPAKVTTQDA